MNSFKDVTLKKLSLPAPEIKSNAAFLRKISVVCSSPAFTIKEKPMQQGHETKTSDLSKAYFREGRELPRGLLAASALCARSPGLPEGVWRDDCLEAAIEARRAYLTPVAERVLRFYVRQTRPADWSEPGRGPVAFVAQCHVAEALGVDRRSVYRAEADLERLGLAVKLTADNGRRYGQKGADGMVCGLYFAPLIAAYERLVAEGVALAEDRARLISMRKLASALRFRVRRLAKATGETPQTASALAELAGLPAQIMEMTDRASLEAIIARLTPLVTALEALCEGGKEENQPVDKSPESNKKQTKMSRKGDSDVPHHIYTTNNSSYVFCNPHGKKMQAASNEAEDHLLCSSANADEKGLRIKNVQAARPVKPSNDSTSRNVGNRANDKDCTNFAIKALTATVLEKCRDRQNQPDLLDALTSSPARDDHSTDVSPSKPLPKVPWSLTQLIGAASVEFRAIIEGAGDGRMPINQQCFIKAAATMCYILGINRAAWNDACTTMGRNEAALAVLVLDRNQNHPTHPVLCPGGALRAMTQRARAGELNLDASIFAIIKRNKNTQLN